jgi:glycosyltransferase involved in cell wall biosynthesis
MGRILRPIAYYREALAAISTVIKSNGLRDLKLVFVNWASDAGIVREVRELIDALGLCGQVIFIDRELDAQELREVYAIADITLNLLRQDQLGSTIFEALAVGSLLVTTDLPQYQRVAAEGARFWFVRTSHVETDLARTLEELIQNLPQAKRRAILPNQEMVRAEYRFDKNSLAFVAAIRKVIQVVQEVPQVLS